MTDSSTALHATCGAAGLPQLACFHPRAVYNLYAEGPTSTGSAATEDAAQVRAYRRSGDRPSGKGTGKGIVAPDKPVVDPPEVGDRIIAPPHCLGPLLLRSSDNRDRGATR